MTAYELLHTNAGTRAVKVALREAPACPFSDTLIRDFQQDYLVHHWWADYDGYFALHLKERAVVGSPLVTSAQAYAWLLYAGLLVLGLDCTPKACVAFADSVYSRYGMIGEERRSVLTAFGIGEPV